MGRCNYIGKGIRFLKARGLREFISAVVFVMRGRPAHPIDPKLSRRLWHMSRNERKRQRKHIFEKDIKFSILVPLYNTPKKFLNDMMDSVAHQTYSNWELCLADGSDAGYEYIAEICRKFSSKHPGKVKYKKLEKNLGIAENTNECIKLSTGDYLALLDHDDVLHPAALFENMKAICESGADFIYSDECKFQFYRKDAFDAFFKPDYAPDALYGCNYICHFTVFSKALQAKVGGFRNRFNGSQDYDLQLRLTEQAAKIVHIPKVLYYWRYHSNSAAASQEAKPYAYTAAIDALNGRLERLNVKGFIKQLAVKGNFRVVYQLDGQPLISIIVPNKDNSDILDKCLRSIFSKTTYENFEVIIVENGSTRSETFDYYKSLESYDKVKLLVWDGPFSYPGINNFAVSKSSGDYIVFLNNDTEIITDNWLEEMLMFAQRGDVGAVGAMLYYPDDSIQHAGIIIGFGEDGVAGHLHRQFPRGSGGYFGRLFMVQNLSAVTAACMMLPRHIFMEVGGFNEEFAVAYNDVDLCMRLRKAGYLIVWTPFAELYHHESKTRGYDTIPENRERFQEEILLFKKMWKRELEAGDPYYNINLSLKDTDFIMRK